MEKLDFAAGQVGLMKEELYALQPKLVIASGITEKLMVKIEQDTVVVEKKKEVFDFAIDFMNYFECGLRCRLLAPMKLWRMKQLLRLKPLKMIVNQI